MRLHPFLGGAPHAGRRVRCVFRMVPQFLALPTPTPGACASGAVAHRGGGRRGSLRSPFGVYTSARWVREPPLHPHAEVTRP